MARYPDSPIPQVPYVFRSNWPTVGGGPEWATQNRPLTRFGLGEADLSYACLTDVDWDTEIKALYDFFESVHGSSGRFTFADFNGWDLGGRAWSGLFVEKGTSAVVTWDLPTFALVASPAPVVYENGTAKTTAVWVSGSTTPSAGTYLIIPGTGTDGVDTLKAGTAPASTVILTIDATCRRAFRRAKFTNVKNPFTWDPPEMSTAGPVTIVEVRK
jgi:hypothetical protein